MNAQYIKTFLIMATGLFLALFLGSTVATSQRDAIMWVCLAATAMLLLGLGKNVWVLLPIGASLAGGLNVLPGSPPVWWGAVMAVGGMLFLRFLMRSQELVLRWTWIDFAILLQVIAIAQAYVRNPTGLAIFGGTVAGGRIYIAYAFAFLGFAILSITKTDLRVLRVVVFVMLGASLADGLIMVLSQYFPGLAALILPIYSGVVFSAAYSGEAASTMESRIEGGKDVGVLLGRAAFSFYSPIKALNPLNFIPFCMSVLAVCFVIISGFRSAFGLLLVYFLVGLIVRRQWIHVIFAGLLALLFLAAVGLAGPLVRELPFGAKRILSVIPFAQVEERIRQSARDSSTWRFEMWRLALATDRYIENKAFGDGFSLSAAELRAVQDAALGDRRRVQGLTMQDIMLERGSFHGFHVETIRYTGVFGLICALIGMVILFKQAANLIRYYKGREEWGMMLFLCVPYLITPFYYMLIFGSYKTGFNIFLMMAGMLKILDNIRHQEVLEARRASREVMAENSLETFGGERIPAAPALGRSR
jgi:hypothetical protein